MTQGLGKELTIWSQVFFVGVRSPGLPRPQAEPHWSLGSLQVLMSSPYEGEGRGIAMLNLLRTLSHSIAPSMADMWELEIPLLIKYLEGEVPTQLADWGTNYVACTPGGEAMVEHHSLLWSLGRWGGKYSVW